MQNLCQHTQILATTCQTQRCGSQQGHILKYNSIQNEDSQTVETQVPCPLLVTPHNAEREHSTQILTIYEQDLPEFTTMALLSFKFFFIFLRIFTTETLCAPKNGVFLSLLIQVQQTSTAKGAKQHLKVVCKGEHYLVQQMGGN